MSWIRAFWALAPQLHVLWGVGNSAPSRASKTTNITVPCLKYGHSMILQPLEIWDRDE